jgi:hypothetical protein
MDETSMIPASGTQFSVSAEMKKVNTDNGSSDPVLTSHSVKLDNAHPVRVTNPRKVVTLRINTEQLREQKKISELNESIRKRSRG